MQLNAEYPVAISHPDKLLWPEAGISKVEYLRYLSEVSPVMLPALRDRPLTLIRFPNGVGGHSFYQKDAPQGKPPWIRTVPLWSDERQAFIHPVLADSVAALLWLGNLACLELHVGFTVIDRPEEPTHVAFDLDPSVRGFEPVREVAMLLHELLDSLGLPQVAKFSGATGLQIFVPLRPGHRYDQTRVLTETVAQWAQQRLPRIVTLERLTKQRGSKVYIDYLQHGRRRTLIAPYSARGTAAATVSAPVTWDELAHGALPAQFTIRTVPDRVRRIGDLMQCGPPADLREIVQFLRQSGARGGHTTLHPV